MNDDQRQQDPLSDGDTLDQRLVHAACRLVENGGAAALSDTGLLAQAAACSPAHIRNAFPAHDDLRLAIADEFYRGLDGRIEPSAQETAAEQIVRGEIDAHEATKFIDAIWDTLETTGPAILIIRTADAAPHFGHNRGRQQRLFAHYDSRWLQAIARAGYSDLDTGIMLAMIISQTKTFAVLLHSGEITCDEARLRHRETLEHLVRDYRRVAVSG